MSRTKESEIRYREIEVWVAKDNIEMLDCMISGKTYFSDPVKHCEDEKDWLKAKLIIELPERKVTITESEFDSILRRLGIYPWSDPELKEKLFSNKSEE